MNSSWVIIAKISPGVILFPLKQGWVRLEKGGVVGLLRDQLELTPDYMRELCEQGCIVEVTGVTNIEQELMRALEEQKKRSGLNQCGQLI